MAFQYEYPLRQEVRRGYAANVVYLYPKVGGAGNVTASAATWASYTPGGTAIATGSATIAAITGIGSQLSITIDASNTTTWVLDENYRVDVSWTHSGGLAYVQTIYLDCVRVPYVPDVGLDQLVMEEADVTEIIDRQRLAIDSARTAAQHASGYGLLAWGDTQALVRTWLEGRGLTRPQALIDAERIRGVVVAYALARVYRAEGGGRDSPDRQRAEDWRAEAESRFQASGPLSEDIDDDGVPDVHHAAISSVKLSRVWR